jgi:hypothetical protein
VITFSAAPPPVKWLADRRRVEYVKRVLKQRRGLLGVRGAQGEREAALCAVRPTRESSGVPRTSATAG